MGCAGTEWDGRSRGRGRACMGVELAEGYLWCEGLLGRLGVGVLGVLGAWLRGVCRYGVERSYAYAVGWSGRSVSGTWSGVPSWVRAVGYLWCEGLLGRLGGRASVRSGTRVGVCWSVWLYGVCRYGVGR